MQSITYARFLAKSGFEVQYGGEDLVLLEERTFAFWIKSLSMITYNIMSDWINSINMC